MTKRSAIARGALAAVVACVCTAGVATAQSSQGYDPDTPEGQFLYASSQIIWPPIEGFINLLQGDPDRNMMISIYTSGYPGEEPVSGSFGELDRCASGLTSSNSAPMARFFGAGICLLANPSIVETYRSEQEAFRNSYRL